MSETSHMPPVCRQHAIDQEETKEKCKATGANVTATSKLSALWTARRGGRTEKADMPPKLSRKGETSVPAAGAKV
jgi:hypothetical protein